MVDITLETMAINSPLNTNITGEEPIETEVGGAGRGARLRELSSIPINTQIGSSYVLHVTDQGKCVTMNSAIANAVTIPTDATAAIPIGATLLVRQGGAGTTSLSAEVGVTVRKRASVSLVLIEQFSTVVLHKIDANVWHLAGELSAA